MSPRRYRSERRRADAEETRRRIVEATVALHAEKGLLATTHAMIAERADVAIPTVYNHFRTRAEVLAACTGHVAAQAPPFGPEIFDKAPDTPSRLRALVRAVFVQHRYYAPWMRWAVHEAPLVPELAAVMRSLRPASQTMIELALGPAFGKTPPRSLVALCDILLDFPTWQRLAGEPDMTDAKVEALVGDALIALAQAHGADTRTIRPAPRTERKTK